MKIQAIIDELSKAKTNTDLYDLNYELLQIEAQIDTAARADTLESEFCNSGTADVDDLIFKARIACYDSIHSDQDESVAVVFYKAKVVKYIDDAIAQLQMFID